MKRKHIFYLLTLGIIVFISIPTFHIINTYLNEDIIKTQIPRAIQMMQAD